MMCEKQLLYLNVDADTNAEIPMSIFTNGLIKI